MTQTELGAKTGKSQPKLSSYEAGSPPEAHWLVCLAQLDFDGRIPNVQRVLSGRGPILLPAGEGPAAAEPWPEYVVSGPGSILSGQRYRRATDEDVAALDAECPEPDPRVLAAMDELRARLAAIRARLVAIEDRLGMRGDADKDAPPAP